MQKLEKEEKKTSFCSWCFVPAFFWRHVTSSWCLVIMTWCFVTRCDRPWSCFPNHSLMRRFGKFTRLIFRFVIFWSRLIPSSSLFSFLFICLLLDFFLLIKIVFRLENNSINEKKNTFSFRICVSRIISVYVLLVLLASGVLLAGSNAS